MFRPTASYFLPLSLAWLLLLVIPDSADARQMQDDLQVRGRVIDTQGEPLPGVTVRIKDTFKGTVSDAEGRFSLRLEDEQTYSLVFSYIGLKKREIEITPPADLEVVLEEDSRMLTDVVITGYNMEKNRTELVGSVVQLESEDLQAERPVESFEKLLSGQVAGLNVENNAGGEPGVPVQVRIRGQGSLPAISDFIRTTSSEPLYVVDGVPIYDIQATRETSVSANEQLLNPLASFNPEDIESISVLKDASATAIYGANAANGVILITTKRGQSGQLKVDLSYNRGISEAINQVNLLSTPDYVALYRETLINSGRNEQEAISRAGPTDIYTSWEDINLRTADFQQANVSVSGGGNNAKARVALNYLEQETITRGNDFSRLNTRANVDVDFGERLSTQYNINFSLINKESLGQFDVRNAPPNLSPLTPDGSFNELGWFFDLPNPLSVLAQNENRQQGLASNGNITAQYLIFPSLRLTALAGLDYTQNNHFTYNSKFNASGRRRNGAVNNVNRQNLQWITNARLNWGTRLGKEWEISALLGVEAQEQTTRLLRAYASDFPFDDLRTPQSANTRNSASSEEEVSTLSYFAEANLEYKSRYFLTFNSRSDASSIFGGDVRRAVFASLGGGWLISEEAFFNKDGLINTLKLRATYGSTGNSRIGSYAARGLYSISSRFSYQGEGGIIPLTAENIRLSWEKNYKTDLAVDIGIGGRITTTIEYYHNQIKDAISTIDVPYESGFQLAEVNAADMLNSGWEFSFRTINVQNKRWEWTTRFNFSTNRNIITDLKLKEEDLGSNTGIGLVEGKDVRTIYGRKYAGVDPYSGRALWQLADGSFTDDYTQARLLENRVEIGSRNPNVFGGISNNLRYGKWSLSLIASYSYGSDILVNSLYEMDGRQFFNNQSVNLLDRWQQPGDLASVPRLHLDNPVVNTNSRFLFDNDHLIIENINLNYQFDTELLKRVNISTASLFAQVSNLAYFYLQQPRENRNGIREYRYSFPQARTWSLGMRVSL
ncbi:MAG: SusC/RagA family TonB-linked outer membrane protein [Cyclobacteriaceae bacterium]